MRVLLESQKKHIREKKLEDSQRNPQVGDEELRHLNADRRHWNKRLDELESELETEPARIQDIYAIRAQRIEPVWQLSLGRCPEGDVMRWPTIPQHSLIKNGLGYVQPVGVVVSTPALLEAGAAINRNSFRFTVSSWRYAGCGSGNAIPKLMDFRRFATECSEVACRRPAGPDESLTISVPGYDEVLHPDYVVKDGDNPFCLSAK